MGVLDYSSTPASNTSISGIGISGANTVANFDNAFRQMMADIAAGITAGSFVPGSTYQPLDSDLTAIAALTTTSFGRAVLALADAAALATYAGVGTGDSPQLAAINLGHASDTTLSRGAAGFVAVEGKRVPSPASQAEGDVLYRGSTEWERLAKGTANQVLRMNSGATAPEWASVDVATSVAALSYGAVGTYVFGAIESNTGLVPGNTYAGSNIVPVGVFAGGLPAGGDAIDAFMGRNGTSSALSGTWRAMGSTAGPVAGDTNGQATLFLRTV